MNCPACGAEVKPCQKKNGDRIVLDANAKEWLGSDRYRIEGENTAVPVSPRYEAYAYGDHERTCPARVRSRERRERK